MKKIDWPSQSKIVVHFAEAPLGALVREALSLNTLLAAFFLGFGELPPVRVATEIPLKIDVCVLHPCAGAVICVSIAHLNALCGRSGRASRSQEAFLVMRINGLSSLIKLPSPPAAPGSRLSSDQIQEGTRCIVDNVVRAKR